MWAINWKKKSFTPGEDLVENDNDSLRLLFSHDTSPIGTVLTKKCVCATRWDLLLSLTEFWLPFLRILTTFFLNPF